MGSKLASSGWGSSFLSSFGDGGGVEENIVDEVEMMDHDAMVEEAEEDSEVDDVIHDEEEDDADDEDDKAMVKVPDLLKGVDKDDDDAVERSFEDMFATIGQKFALLDKLLGKQYRMRAKVNLPASMYPDDLDFNAQGGVGGDKEE